MANLKSKIPLFFLISISFWWAFYYQRNSFLNDYGDSNFEWLFLIDSLIVVPILCILCIKNKKEAALKSLFLACFAVLIGSYIIPEQNKYFWQFLEKGRYLVVAAIVLFETVAIFTVFLAIKSSIQKYEDPDASIQNSI